MILSDFHSAAALPSCVFFAPLRDYFNFCFGINRSHRRELPLQPNTRTHPPLGSQGPIRLKQGESTRKARGKQGEYFPLAFPLLSPWYTPAYQLLAGRRISAHRFSSEVPGWLAGWSGAGSGGYGATKNQKLSFCQVGRARHSVRAGPGTPASQRRARSDAPYPRTNSHNENCSQRTGCLVVRGGVRMWVART